jgi:hypothetical protein
MAVGGCDVSSQGWRLATDAGIDCGSIDISLLPYRSVDAGAVALGIDCAFSAQDAGLPFVLLLQFSGADTSTGSAYVRTPDGGPFLLSQFSDNCQPATLQLFPCGAFVPEAISPEASRTDGGLPGIGCANQGPSTCVCVQSGC